MCFVDAHMCAAVCACVRVYSVCACLRMFSAQLFRESLAIYCGGCCSKMNFAKQHAQWGYFGSLPSSGSGLCQERVLKRSSIAWLRLPIFVASGQYILSGAHEV